MARALRTRTRPKKSKPARVVIKNLYDPNVKYTAGKEERRTASKERHVAKKKRLKELGYDKYEDYLFSDGWRHKRVAFVRAGRSLSCISCGHHPTHLHHRSYENLGNEPLSDLDPLCARCHKLAHKAARWLVGITLWNCSRNIAHLIQLGYGTERFDQKAWNQRYSKPEKVAKAKQRGQERKQGKPQQKYPRQSQRPQSVQHPAPPTPREQATSMRAELSTGLDKHLRECRKQREGFSKA